MIVLSCAIGVKVCDEFLMRFLDSIKFLSLNHTNFFLRVALTTLCAGKMIVGLDTSLKASSHFGCLPNKFS